MAIYSLRATAIGKSTHAPGTAAAHLAYICRTSACRQIVCDNLPEPAPGTRANTTRAWMNDQENADRKNARLLDKVTAALPVELTPQQRVDLVRDFIERIGATDIPWLAAIHDTQADADNPHAHLVLRDRHIETGKRALGLGKRDVLRSIRKTWADSTNDALEAAGHEARVDHRTLEAQGIDRTPTKHRGPIPEAIEEDGRESWKLGALQREAEEAEAKRQKAEEIRRQKEAERKAEEDARRAAQEAKDRLVTQAANVLEQVWETPSDSKARDILAIWELDAQWSTAELAAYEENGKSIWDCPVEGFDGTTLEYLRNRLRLDAERAAEAKRALEAEANDALIQVLDTPEGSLSRDILDHWGLDLQRPTAELAAHQKNDGSFWKRTVENFDGTTLDYLRDRLRLDAEKAAEAKREAAEAHRAAQEAERAQRRKEARREAERADRALQGAERALRAAQREQTAAEHERAVLAEILDGTRDLHTGQLPTAARRAVLPPRSGPPPTPEEEADAEYLAAHCDDDGHPCVPAPLPVWDPDEYDDPAAFETAHAAWEDGERARIERVAEAKAHTWAERLPDIRNELGLTESSYLAAPTRGLGRAVLDAVRTAFTWMSDRVATARATLGADHPITQAMRHDWLDTLAATPGTHRAVREDVEHHADGVRGKMAELHGQVDELRREVRQHRKLDQQKQQARDVYRGPSGPGR